MSSKKWLPWKDKADKAMMTCYLHYAFHLFWSVRELSITRCECVWNRERTVMSLCVCSKFITCFLCFCYLLLPLCMGSAAGWLYQEAVSGLGYFNFIGFKEDLREVGTLAPSVQSHLSAWSFLSAFQLSCDSLILLRPGLAGKMLTAAWTSLCLMYTI